MYIVQRCIRLVRAQRTRFYVRDEHHHSVDFHVVRQWVGCYLVTLIYIFGRVEEDKGIRWRINCRVSWRECTCLICFNIGFMRQRNLAQSGVSCYDFG